MASKSSKKAARGRSSGQRVTLGEPMPEILGQLRDVSARCLMSSLTYSQACPEDSQESINAAKSCMQLLGLRNQMRQQVQDMKTDFLTRGTLRENIDSSFNVSLAAARDPLEDEMCSFRNKELALHRMQIFNALLTGLQKDPSQRPSVVAVMRRCRDHAKLIFAMQLTNRDLEAELISTRRKRMEMRIRQQDLFRKLKYSEQINHKIQDIELKAHIKERENLEKISNQVVILQEVLQRCVISARVHWADNPYLKSLLLQMKDS